jgi:hypothetical protein
LSDCSKAWYADGMPLISALNSVALVLVVPLGLALLPVPGPLRRPPLWVATGALAATSIWLPRGVGIALLTLPYAGLAAALAVVAASGVLRGRLRGARDLAVATALVAPTVAVSALAAERAGLHLLGFSFTVLALTVAHFHAAGFAAALIAGLGAGVDGRPARFAAAGVPAGLGLVFVGFFTTAWVGVAGTAVLTAGLWLTAWTTLHRVRGARDRLTRTLLVITAVVPLATMLLALDWALGQATDLPHPSLTWMAATHGVANLLGFAVCGLLAWRRATPVGCASRDDDSLHQWTVRRGMASPPGTCSPASMDRDRRRSPTDSRAGR